MKKSTMHLINAGINSVVAVATYAVTCYGLKKMLPKGTASPRLYKWTIGALASAAATANIICAAKSLDDYQAALDDEEAVETKLINSQRKAEEESNTDYAYEARMRADDALTIFSSMNNEFALIGNTLNVIEKLERKSDKLTIGEKETLQNCYADLEKVNKSMSKASLKLPIPMNVHYWNNENIYSARELHKETKKYLRTVKNFLQLSDKSVTDTYNGPRD